MRVDIWSSKVGIEAMIEFHKREECAEKGENDDRLRCVLHKPKSPFNYFFLALVLGEGVGLKAVATGVGFSASAGSSVGTA